MAGVHLVIQAGHLALSNPNSVAKDFVGVLSRLHYGLLDRLLVHANDKFEDFTRMRGSKELILRILEGVVGVQPVNRIIGCPNKSDLRPMGHVNDGVTQVGRE
jgi:hypothetical protein